MHVQPPGLAVAHGPQHQLQPRSPHAKALAHRPLHPPGIVLRVPPAAFLVLGQVGVLVCSGQVKAVLVKIGQHLALSAAQAGGFVPALLPPVTFLALLAPPDPSRGKCPRPGMCPRKGSFFPGCSFFASRCPPCPVNFSCWFLFCGPHSHKINGYTSPPKRPPRTLIIKRKGLFSSNACRQIFPLWQHPFGLTLPPSPKPPAARIQRRRGLVICAFRPSRTPRQSRSG